MVTETASTAAMEVAPLVHQFTLLVKGHSSRRKATTVSFRVTDNNTSPLENPHPWRLLLSRSRVGSSMSIAESSCPIWVFFYLYITPFFITSPCRVLKLLL
ncbi:hypothetical protein V6N13_134574 [Hibiscus sabdariffa]